METQKQEERAAEPVLPAVPVLGAGAGPRRRLMFVAVFLLLAGAGNLLFADYLWRSQLYGLKYVILVLFFVLFTYLAFSFTTTLFGFIARSRRLNISGSIDAAEIEIPDDLPPTAILFPIYNEDVCRVMAGLRAAWRSLEATGKRSSFDFFVLSDSRNPDKWVEEEVAWLATCRELGAIGRIHYRRRRKNTNKKAGNIAEFVDQWGKGYRYMIIFDADSVMTGVFLVKLVALIEKLPLTGIIQTVPRVVEAETPYARSQQFASALYGPVFSAGLNFWQQAEGNYWGHNAIIRVAPFMEYCALPDLPWREPLGGKILSHDFVEAALMVRAGYKVWLAHNLEGSYEESPPSPVEAAERDRRWCQGNLQHAWLLFARGFSRVSRIHLINGILSYLNAFFWFWFLLLSTLVVVQFNLSKLSLIATPAFFGRYEISLTAHGLLIMGLTAVLLFAPKFFAVIDLLRNSKRRQAFGGFWRAAAGAVSETLYSAMLAPLNMLWHATFIVTIPMGQGAAWNAQQRTAGGLGFFYAVRVLGWMTLVGAIWALVAWRYGGSLFAWIAPVLIPLVVSIPFAQFSSAPEAGLRLRRRGVWMTPEERQRPEILDLVDKEEEALRETLAHGESRYSHQALLDPYVNALHVSMEEPHGEPDEDLKQILKVVEDNIEDIAKISDADMLRILSSPIATRTAHLLLWTGANKVGLEERKGPFSLA